MKIEIVRFAAYLLVTNGELALCLLVRIGVCLELLDRLRLQDLDAKLHVTLGVLVAGLEIWSACLATAPCDREGRRT